MHIVHVCMYVRMLYPLGSSFA